MSEPDCTIDRTLRIPAHAIERLLSGEFLGRALAVPVAVNWPELRLSEEQVLANAIAAASGHLTPYPDPSIFTIELPVVEGCYHDSPR